MTKSVLDILVETASAITDCSHPVHYVRNNYCVACGAVKLGAVGWSQPLLTARLAEVIRKIKFQNRAQP